MLASACNLKPKIPRGIRDSFIFNATALQFLIQKFTTMHIKALGLIGKKSLNTWHTIRRSLRLTLIVVKYKYVIACHF